MKAFIFAAGLGTRLRPLTAETPKALIEAGGLAMLEHAARALVGAGADTLVVNVHHFPEKIEAFVKARSGFGVRTEFSREVYFPLETGGGLRKAAPLLAGPEPFFAYNCDVYTDMDLKAMYSAHQSSGALATLAVKERGTSRQLLFDAELNLRGRWSEKDGFRWAGPEIPGALKLAFSGVHVISPAIFEKMTETGVFSIMDVYLRLAGAGEAIRGFRMDSAYWGEIGSKERLEALRAHLDAKKG